MKSYFPEEGVLFLIRWDPWHGGGSFLASDDVVLSSLWEGGGLNGDHDIIKGVFYDGI